MVNHAVIAIVTFVVIVIIGILIAVLYYNARKAEATTPELLTKLRDQTALIAVSFALGAGVIALVLYFVMAPKTAVVVAPVAKPKETLQQFGITDKQVADAKAAAITLAEYNKALQDIPKISISNACGNPNPNALVIPSCSDPRAACPPVNAVVQAPVAQVQAPAFGPAAPAVQAAPADISRVPIRAAFGLPQPIIGAK